MLVQLPFFNSSVWSETPLIWVILALIVIGSLIAWNGRKHRSGEVTYLGKAVVSPWEQRIIQTLMGQLPDGLHLCSQVRLAEIIKVQSPDRGAWRGAFNRIACKSVDFAVMDLSNGSPILVIELDDRTHARPDRDALVNEVLGAACIPLVKFKPSRRLDIRPHLPGQAVLMR